MAFYERRCTRDIIRRWRAFRARKKKAEQEAARLARALAKENAKELAKEAARENANELAKEKARTLEMPLSVEVREEEANFEDAPASTAPTPEGDQSDITVDDAEDPQPSPSDARVGANLGQVVK